MGSYSYRPEHRFLAHYRQSDQVEQDLWDHLQQTGELAAAIASKVGLAAAGELIGLIHDLGKATDTFNQYIRTQVGLVDPDEDGGDDAPTERGKIDHSTAGAQIIYDLLMQDPSNRLAAEILSLTVASHHSGLIDCLSPRGENLFARRLAKDPVATRRHEAWANLHPDIRDRIEHLVSAGVGKAVQGAIGKSLSQSDGEKERRLKIGMMTRFLFSALIDADRLDTASFENPHSQHLRNQGRYVSWDMLIDALEERLRRFSADRPIDQLRREISENCRRVGMKERGIYRLTVPTGGGKTLASLRFALYHARKHSMDRIIYVIPYTSIIDQNAQVIRDILDAEAANDLRSSIVLEHHSNLTPDLETDPQHRLLAENWDAPVVLTTMVQFLEALFGAGTRSARRMHQLANAVIIFDEIQTLPVRCVHLFNVALQFLVQGCGSTALLCTATQPLLDQVEPSCRALPITEEQEITPNVERLYQQLRRVGVLDMVRPSGWTASEIAALAEVEMDEHGSVLVIVNTKSVAATVFTELKSKGVAPLYHLSTNMCPAHRLAVLSEVRCRLERHEPVICVSTQLIEAGVDIDFDVVIRSVAGLDSVTQAAGRCNRNAKRRELGRLLLVNVNDEHLDKLIDIKIGRQVTERILHEFRRDPQSFDSDLLGPAALERYFTYYFYERRDEMDYRVSAMSPVGRTDSLYELLSTNAVSVAEHRRVNSASPNLILRQSFMSAARTFAAIDNSGQGILVPYEDGERIISALCAEHDLVERYELLREAQRYSVNLHPHDLRKHSMRGAIRETDKGSGLFYLDGRHYDSELGFTANVTEIMATLIT